MTTSEQPGSNPSASPSGADAPLLDHDALQPGMRLGEFEILKVLGIGGFGIVYLAMDHALERHVAIKEYMPAALARRSTGPQVSIRSSGDADTFAVGLRSFVNEAKLLARFDHPALVKVYRFWEANGTAYMVMPYYEGATLKDVRSRMAEPPAEDWLRGLLLPLLGALDTLHGESCYHRDIAPDNILLLKSGKPVLLDFGAARRIISDRTHNLTAILKPNFAPIEQYADANLDQGPWTDLYALGAVVYHCVTGQAPTPSVARAMRDTLTPLSIAAAGHYSEAFLAAIDWALAVKPQDRPRTVQDFREALEGHAIDVHLPDEAASGPAAQAWEPTEPAALDYPATRPAVAAAYGTVPSPRAGPGARPAGASSDWFKTAQIQPTQAAATPAGAARGAASVAAPPKRKRRIPRLVLATLGLVVGAMLGVGGAYLVSKRGGADRAALSSVPWAASAPVAQAPAAGALSVAASAPAGTEMSSEPAAVASSAPAATSAADRLQGGDTARPAPRTARRAEPRPAVETSTPVPTAENRANPRSPREACGGRVFIAMSLCIERECEKPEFAQHPTCVKLHKRQELRRPYTP